MPIFCRTYEAYGAKQGFTINFLGTFEVCLFLLNKPENLQSRFDARNFLVKPFLFLNSDTRSNSQPVCPYLRRQPPMRTNSDEPVKINGHNLNAINEFLNPVNKETNEKILRTLKNAQ